MKAKVMFTLFLIGSIFFCGKNVEAKECYVVNNNGVCISSGEYERLLNQGFFDFEIMNMSNDIYNENKDLEAVNKTNTTKYVADTYYYQGNKVYTSSREVTEEEYNNTQKFVDYYLDSTDLKYASGLNVKLGLFSIKKKFFTSKKHKQFTTQKYPKSAKNVKINKENESEYLNRFVCSTFIGYVLYNNVQSVSDFFDKYNIKYDYLNVTDLSLIPGMTPLFYSTWANYLEAAKEFVTENDEFSEYLTQ